MRETLHADLLNGALDSVVATEGRGPAEVRGVMELEHEVSVRERSPLSVLAVVVDDLERLAEASGLGADEILASVTSALRVLPREGDLIALREQSAVFVVLPRTGAEAAEAFARRAVEAARRLPVPRRDAPLAASVSIGLAFLPMDAGCWLETLLAVALDGSEVAAGGGGGRAVHTQLYAFHQRRLEREHPDRPKPSPPPPAKHQVAAPAAAPPPGSGTTAVPAVVASAPAAGGSPRNVLDLEEKVLRLAREWAQEALAKALAEQEKEHSSKIDLLERRIRKLTHSLEEAQADLERAQAGAEIDPGVASAFKAVQGLRAGPGVAAKLEMLAKLVEMNLALRAQFSARA